LRREKFCRWSGRHELTNSGIDGLTAVRRNNRLRNRPLRSGYGAAAVVAAATRPVNVELSRIFRRSVMAMMRSVATAAGMRRCGSRRQRQRNKISGKRKQQQKSRNQTLHDFR
jgi:hypothetical protein